VSFCLAYAEEMEMLPRNKRRSQEDGDVVFVQDLLWVDGLAFEF